MARLNEAPPSVESVDALKRRFVRQNREIARANSTQSLRIRSLEGEVSRLLSENIGLREQIIKLKHELQKDPGRSLLDNVGNLKGSLEAKLSELGSLVQDLGNVQKRDDGQSPQRNYIVRASPRRSPDQKNWRNALTLSEVTGGMDGRLPPIVEDKYYPRRTLDAEEMLGLLDDPAHTPESPDLGPPPVAHFEDGDPVKTDAEHLKGIHIDPSTTENVIPDVLPENLETRKKRRESAKYSEPRRSGSDSAASLYVSNGTTHEPHQPLKSGAKRKLSARDDDHRPEILTVEHGSTFNGSHDISKNGNIDVLKDEPMRSNGSVSRKVSENLASDGQKAEKVKNAPITNNPSVRKVLGPKSVNTDPVVSPMRPSKSLANDKGLEPEKNIGKKPRDRKVEKRCPLDASVIPPKAPETVTASNDPPPHLSALPPETPVPPSLDLFSPVSPGPSAARPESKDTPPPEDLNSTASNTGSFGRSSRRPRGSVSYAEPNLRHKMRRPTKDLVDAVGVEERHLQASILKSAEEMDGAGDIDSRPAEKSTMRTVYIKKEVAPDSIQVWKTLATKSEDAQQKARAQATSPLGSKAVSVTADLPASVLTDRRRRMSSLQKSNSEPAILGKEGSRSAIAALIAGTKKVGTTVEEQGKEDSGEAKEIYELADSSPADVSVKDNLASARASRRHSTVPATARQASGRASAEPDPGKPNAELIAKSKERRREAESRTARSTGSFKGSVEGGGTVGRAERTASRRRSMML